MSLDNGSCSVLSLLEQMVSFKFHVYEHRKECTDKFEQGTGRHRCQIYVNSAAICT